MASIYEETNKVCHTLVTSCISIIGKIQNPGCDNKSFLQGVQRATTDTQNLVQYVKGIQTRYTSEKEQLFQKTIIVKNVVVKLITDLRVYYKNSVQGQPAATAEQVAPLRAELSAALKEVGKAAQILAAAEANAPTNSNESSAVYTTRSNLPGLPGMPKPPLNRATTESSMPQPTATLESPEAIAETASKCLEAMSEMSVALENRNRDLFTNSTKTAINYVNQLVVQKSDGVPEDARMELRQNLVSLISHSKMYFVNPDDEYIKEAFFMFKGKVETAVKAFLPEGTLLPSSNGDSISQSEPNAEWDSELLNSPQTALTVSVTTPMTLDNAESNAELDEEEENFRGDTSEHQENQNSTNGADSQTESLGSSISEEPPVIPAAKFSRAVRTDSGVSSPLSESKARVTSRAEAPKIGDRIQQISGTGLRSGGLDSARGVPEHNEEDEHPMPSSTPISGPAATNGTHDEHDEPVGRDEHDDIDLQFSKTIIQLMKNHVPGDWNNFDSTKEAQFELLIKNQLNAFKRMIIANHVHSALRTQRSSEDKTAVAPSPISVRTISSVSLRADAGSVKVKAKNKSSTSGFSMKTVGLKTGAIFTNKPARMDIPQFRFLDFTSPTGGAITPRTKFSKSISDVTCAAVSEIFTLLNNFNDVGFSWNGGKNATSKGTVKSDSKEPELKKKVVLSCSRLMEQVKETITLLLNSPISETGATFEKIKTRIFEEIKEDIKPISIRVDDSKFTKGQYLRYMKRSLLIAIFGSMENLTYLVSQFLSVVRAYRSFESHAIHVLNLASLCKSTLQSLLNDVETFYVVEDEFSKKVKLDMNKIKRKKGDALKNSIWKEKEEPHGLDKTDLFRAGTLNALIIRLTATTFNSDLMAAFLAGYELFSSPLEVWEKLLDRYHVPKDVPENTQAQFVKMRVANVVLQWLKLDFHSIDTNVIASIEHFADKTLKKDKFSELSGWMARELLQTDMFSVKKIKDKEPLKVIPIFELVSLAPYECVLIYDRQTVAEQLTLIEFELYSNIKKAELTDQKWSKEKLNVLARNVISLIQRVNHVSHFCATAILIQNHIRERTNVLVRLIGVAKALYDMKNFNGLMGILVGLSLSPVSRLRHTWSKVPSKHLETFKQLENHQDPASSFKFLRDQIKAAGAMAIPYIGTYLSDLTFMDEGNPDFINMDNNKLINFPKHHLIMRTIKQLLQYQNSKFEIQSKEPLYTFLYTMPSLHEKELYELSLEREPRDSQLKDII